MSNENKPSEKPVENNSQETKPQVESSIQSQKTVTLDWPKALEHISKVSDYYKSFEGKKDHNPFLVYNNTVKPLVERYNKGERTPELYNSILGLSLSNPPLVKDVTILK